MEIRDLPHVPLFRGLAEEGTALALAALNARRLPFRRGRQLLQAGQCTGRFGLVLAGRVHIEHLDVWGSKTLLGQAQEGDLFAETYACLPHEPWRQQLTRNLLEIAARKNLELARRNLYTAPKTIRGRVTAYFSALAVKSGSLRFTLPYDRQQLADYLGVDRSALSSTLSQMQRDGLLVLGRRTVELRTPPETL